ncbi:hypothetical protein, partial [Paracoccus sp. (in: a-proteobacteria)]|uniref:hypothetical protein n=1 Tax=Paracoccus sp. TaxID=267 RepID=UPI0028A67018
FPALRRMLERMAATLASPSAQFNQTATLATAQTETSTTSASTGPVAAPTVVSTARAATGLPARLASRAG